MDCDFFIDEDSVLERVDEYSLFCHYLGFEPEIKQNYHSPLRDGDSNPSFALYPNRRGHSRELLWKDSGDRGDKGDIFKLVQLLYGLPSRKDAVVQVKSDFGLGGTTTGAVRIVYHQQRNKGVADIRVRPRAWKPEDLRWWQQWNVSQDILERHRVSPLYCYWSSPAQKAPVFPGRKSYVYRIRNKYQLYFPDRIKDKKFRMDLGDTDILGFEQLRQQSDLLVITKSNKDVMCLESFGYEAISPRSENIPLPFGAFDWISSHYKRALVLFDNDGKHRAEWYPYPLVQIPPGSGSKDPSDFVRDHGLGAARELFRQLTLK